MLSESTLFYDVSFSTMMIDSWLNLLVPIDTFKINILYLGSIYTTTVPPEVVVYQNNSSIDFMNQIGSVDIRENDGYIFFHKQIEEYLAVKVKNDGIYLEDFYRWKHFEIWIDK